MNLKHNYWYFPKAVPKKTCDKIIETFKKQKVSKGSVTPATTSSTYSPDLKMRNCKIRWGNEVWIYDILNSFIHAANKNSGWNFQWDWNQSIQFTEYSKNQFYDWHIDQHWKPYLPSDPDINIRNKIRKLSLTLQLTHPSKYTGGNLEFMWFDGTKKNEVKKNSSYRG